MGIIEQTENKGKITKNYLKGMRKLLETKLYGKNLIKGINNLAVSLVRCFGPFFKWTRQIDQRTRKLMTMYKALHLKDDIDRLASMKDCINASTQDLEEYIKKSKERLITALATQKQTEKQ